MKFYRNVRFAERLIQGDTVFRHHAFIFAGMPEENGWCFRRDLFFAREFFEKFGIGSLSKQIPLLARMRERLS